MDENVITAGANFVKCTECLYCRGYLVGDSYDVYERHCQFLVHRDWLDFLGMYVTELDGCTFGANKSSGKGE